MADITDVLVEPRETGGFYWNGGDGEAIQIRYWFAETGFGFKDPIDDFQRAVNATSQEFSQQQKDAVREVIRLWAEVALVELVPTDDPNLANLFLYNATVSNRAAETRTLVNKNGVITRHVIINLAQFSSNQLVTPGQLGFRNLLHEFGHVLGFKHPGVYSSPPDPGPYLGVGDFAQIPDDMRRTVISDIGYRPHLSWNAYPSTPLLVDIAAAQRVFGANKSTRANDGDVYQFTSSSVDVKAIWDAGGIHDRIDASNQSTPSYIDLRAGSLSSIGPAGIGSDNIAIAFGVVIEDATGGSRSDVIVGNSVSNVLQGLTGDDYLAGLEGSDRLEGGEGNDTLVGGLGDDVLLGGVGNDVYVWAPGDGNDQIIEQRDADGVVRGRVVVRGLSYELNVVGPFVPVRGATNTWKLPGTGITLKHNSPWLLGMPDGGSIGLGEDFLPGHLGISVLNDAPGFPTFILEFEGDRRILGSYLYVDPDTGDTEWRLPNSIPYDEYENAIRDPDLVIEGGSNDEFFGSPNNDIMYGRDGADRLHGGDGDDQLFGGKGSDYMEGGDGSDVLVGFEDASGDDVFSDELHGGAGNDQLFAGAVLSLDEAVEMAGLTVWDGGGSSLFGEDGDDILVGSNHFDFMSGGAGNDLLIGGRHRDQLEGDEGNDVLIAGADGAAMYGGTGSDVLVANEYAVTGSHMYGGSSGYEPLDGNDLLIGNKYADYIQGGAGSDRVFAGDGDDVFEDDHWAYFDPDEIYMGGGHDYVSASHGDDLIDGGDGDDTLVGNGGNDLIHGGAGNDLLDGGWRRQAAIDPGNGNSIEYVYIASGNDSLYGEDGDDRLVGGDGDDYLVGGRCIDLLEGGSGGDAYVFNVGDGLDTINDFDESLPGQDTVYFGPGITPDNIRLLATPIDDRLFVLFDNPEDRIVFPQWFFGNRFKIESFVFADGTSWDITEIESNAGSDGPSIANDVLVGTSGDDVIHGLEGDDQISDSSGNDILYGDEGRDLIIDSDGHNLLVGGTDRDFLRLNGVPIYDESGEEEIGLLGGSPGSFAIGGRGGDGVLIDDHSVVAYNAGDGDDSVRWTAGNVQKLAVSLGGGLSRDDVYLSHLGFRFLLNIGPEIVPEDEEEVVTQPGISLPNLLAQPSLWPAITLQIIGQDIRLYDFNAVVQNYLDELAVNPDLTYWSAAQALESSLLEVSSTHALGGAIAYQYGTTGSVDALTPAQIRAVLGDAAFGFSVQKIEANAGNSSPVLASTIADQSTNEDVAYGFVIPADTFVDLDEGDTLTYAATLEDGSSLPAWLAFDALTRTFSGTPLQIDVGTLNVKVTATDGGGLSAADTFALTVENVNDAPVVAVPLGDWSFEAGSAFSFSVPATTFGDEDPGDTLSLSASIFGGLPLPAWLSFDAASATFTGNPSPSNIGISHLQVTATDAAGASAASDFGLVVRAAAGSEVVGTPDDDVLYGGTGDETITAKGGNDYLYGDIGDDLLKGGGGNDVLQGGDGADVLRGGKGQNVLDGGAGDDLIFGGKGSSLIVGGTGNDTIRTGAGSDVILFNRGDGMDTVIADRAGDNTLSFGGGIRYSDLSLSRDGKNLIVSAGDGDQITFKNWYTGKHSVLNLQIVLDATDEFDAASPDPLYNKKVQTFDFLGMVSAFDATQAQTPGLTSWAITNALLQFHLFGADDMALGGDLAYWYGRKNSFSGLSLAAAQQAIGAAGFGADAQNLRPFDGLQEGYVKLV